MVCTNTLRRTERWSRTTSRLTRITVLMIEMESLLRLHLIVKRMSYLSSSSKYICSRFVCGLRKISGFRSVCSRVSHRVIYGATTHVSTVTAYLKFLGAR